MKGRGTMLVSILAVVLLALVVGLTQAQGPQLPGEGAEPEVAVGVEGDVASRIPIQGRLTDDHGNPLHGTYTVNLYLYDAASGGNLVCSDTTGNSVPVDHGLFQWNFAGDCGSNDINGQQLYLELRVEGETLSPRQPIYPVPYAFSLKPGPVIGGGTDWVVSPLKIVPGDYGSNWDDLKIILSAQHGFAKLYTDGQDDCRALLPVDVVASLFGTRVKLSAFHFCYRMDNTDEKITQVDVDYVGDDGVAHNLGSYALDVSSTTWACRDLALTSPAAIYGPVFMRFHLHFAGDGSSRSIRLGHMYLRLTE